MVDILPFVSQAGIFLPENDWEILQHPNLTVRLSWGKMVGEGGQPCQFAYSPTPILAM
jgi:hypothetical protein